LVARAIEQVAALDPDDLAAFDEAGVRIGARVIYVASLLKPVAIANRAALAAVYFGPHTTAPRAGAVSIKIAGQADEAAYVTMGYPVFGNRAIRADIVERVVAQTEPIDDKNLAS